MNDKQTVKERLVKFIKYNHISQSKFEKETGLSNAYVSNIRVSIQPKSLGKISSRYPELNIGWLLTGEGDMLKTTPNEQIANGVVNQQSQGNGNKTSQTISGDPKNLSEALKIIGELSKKNQELTERLMSMIEKLTDKGSMA